jgi:hypothetical protein
LRRIGRDLGEERVARLKQRVEHADLELVKQLRVDSVLPRHPVSLRQAERDVAHPRQPPHQLLDAGLEPGVGNMLDAAGPKVDLDLLERLGQARRGGLRGGIVAGAQPRRERLQLRLVGVQRDVARQVVQRHQEHPGMPGVRHPGDPLDRFQRGFALRTRPDHIGRADCRHARREAVRPAAPVEGQEWQCAIDMGAAAAVEPQSGRDAAALPGRSGLGLAAAIGHRAAPGPPPRHD